MKDVEWAETPMFILRRDCVAIAAEDWPAGHFLEIGAGTGRLTTEFLRRGFTGVCYDLGEENRAVLRSNLSVYAPAVTVIDHLADLPHGAFDFVLAFEVLEHIADDGAALRQWAEHLKPGGRLLLSVPAHQRKFDAEDRAVGHYRRYEKRQIESLVRGAGLVDVRVLSYGFPLAAITRMGRRVLDSGGAGDAAGAVDPEVLSMRSGIARTRASLSVSRVLNSRTLAPFVALQRLFLGRDLGDGYVVSAARPAGAPVHPTDPTRAGPAE